MAKGQVTWFEILIYTYVRRVCKNIFVKIFVHLVGLILMVLGIYLLVFTMPSIISIMGVFFGIIGFIVFITPIGVK